MRERTLQEVGENALRVVFFCEALKETVSNISIPEKQFLFRDFETASKIVKSASEFDLRTLSEVSRQIDPDFDKYIIEAYQAAQILVSTVSEQGLGEISL